MEQERSLEFSFVLSPADFSAAHSRAQSERRLRAMRSLSYHFLVGIPLMLATNILDGSGALAGILGVVGMMIIVTGIMTNLSPILARKGEVADFEPEPTLIRVSTTGISKHVADSETRIGWRSVDKITLTEFGIGFLMQEGGWLIPMSAFGSESSMKAGYDKIVSVMASGQADQDTEHSEPRTLH
ncbi:hypothetical protein BPNPMPFG_005339 [Mesorhizobium sp. AR07]|uniref:hypothetical protein n=1 Tax=Mesorhizobium sp. AR07 TaxID=2865838 RepID=UPI00215DF58A|nr:hypothetical protein [Mesorhizobium sp. AR07]UVK43535.1 hypothetical protein BPNPMPFG_005339 [Mesorhizobium sp. AR07]